MSKQIDTAITAIVVIGGLFFVIKYVLPQIRRQSAESAAAAINGSFLGPQNAAVKSVADTLSGVGETVGAGIGPVKNGVEALGLSGYLEMIKNKAVYGDPYGKRKGTVVAEYTGDDGNNYTAYDDGTVTMSYPGSQYVTYFSNGKPIGTFAAEYDPNYNHGASGAW